MDVTTIILGVTLINVAVFLAGCALAVIRTHDERRAARHLARSGRRLGHAPVADGRLHHAGRRAH